jgi:hypothetical protein
MLSDLPSELSQLQDVYKLKLFQQSDSRDMLQSMLCFQDIQVQQFCGIVERLFTGLRIYCA